MLKPTQNYQLLKAQTSQQLLKVVDTNWKSFFKAVKEYKKDRSKFNGRPQPPHYKKECDNLVIFTNQNSKIKDTSIILTMSKLFKETYPEFKDPIKLSIPKYNKKNFEEYQQKRILPRRQFYEIEIVYKKEITHADVNQDSYLSIDFGVNNLITTV
ncbi:MAG: hypothetical protein BAJALOKI1v1_720014 [Promethearchaeota archaeon]|nr:MAG: hypothetical protein BAJALOKI1v1_720014 [Candidatus Lokiarchaeota archaeon]